MPTYTVKRSGFILGEHVNANSDIELTDRQARDFLREGRIVTKVQKVEAKPAKADAKS